MTIYSDVVLESGSVLESDSSTYFEDSDSDSDTDSCPQVGWTRGVQELDSALYDFELINYLYFICYRYSMYRYVVISNHMLRL